MHSTVSHRSACSIPVILLPSERICGYENAHMGLLPAWLPSLCNGTMIPAVLLLR